MAWSVIKMAAQFLVFVFLVVDCPSAAGSTVPSHSLPPPTSFRAAVYEHFPLIWSHPPLPVTRDRALELMEGNLLVYKEQTKKAKEQGADILVFPENGLNGDADSRKAIFPFLERIPDPEVVQWSPCSDPTRFPDSEVQFALSCMAKDNRLYLVANMGDYVPCNASLDPKCPADGRYQYNTDVAYGPDGKLLAKYHKLNLFYENEFDTPAPKVVYFDTPFGRVGMLVCNDILYKDPSVNMVTDYNITIIAFPTAWPDALPLLSAIGYHSSFPRGLGVTLLSANIHLPSGDLHGSGIFTPDGMSSFYYNSDPLSPGQLLVSTVDIVTQPRLVGKKEDTPTTIHKTNDGSEFQADLYTDMFTFRLLDGSSGHLSVCQKNVCCSLTYSLAEPLHSQSELFAFGVFDGLHTFEGNYYFQICTLVKCAEHDDRSTCGSPTSVSTTKFKSFSITGHFQTKFVYPQVVLSESGQQLALADHTQWTFQGTTLMSQPGIEDRSILSATLFGRYYSQDDVIKDDHNWNNDRHREIHGTGGRGARLETSLLTLSALVCLLFCINGRLHITL